MAGDRREPLAAKGEAAITINGKRRLIRFSLAAQARIVEAMEIDGIEEIPALLRKLDARTFGVLIQAALVPDDGLDPLSLEEILEASIPLMQAQASLVRAITYAMYGNTPPDPPMPEGETSPPEETAEKSESDGVSTRH